MANNTTKNGVYVPSILMQKFRGKGPQNAGNGISGCLDLKMMRGFYKAPVKKNARSAAEWKAFCRSAISCLIVGVIQGLSFQ